ncbi:uncharacterized protein [Ptychodera flava]|uniref:uncharacterized protein n=1 Tax=Ptychodera flava TaxID=63121 RepID=UPI003969D112
MVLYYSWSDADCMLRSKDSVTDIPLTKDLAFWMCKTVQVEEGNVTLPAWTGFNQQLSSNIIRPVSKIGYLPVIDASPTDKSTINTVLSTSVDIANKLRLQSVVLNMDLAIYSKAQEIRWQNEEYTQRLILRLGEFHTAMSFLSAIGKRFRDAGLEDIMIESGILAQGSVNGVMSGHHYNRSVRCHKLVAEAMHRLRFNEFLDSLTEEEHLPVIAYLLDLRDSYPHSFTDAVNTEEMKQLQQKYTDHIQKCCESNVNYAFWSSYLNMVQLLLLFIRGTREGDWHLHLAAIRQMLPWYFAYGKVNYSRYLPVYLQEMLALPQAHPHVYEKFCEGEFAVQRSCDHPFSMTACDQVIEQTFNRESKTKGGLVGFTQNKGALNRWILSHPARSAITTGCFTQAGKTDKQSEYKDLTQSRMKRDESDVQEVMSTLLSVGSPFTSDKDSQLVHLTAGALASEEITSDLTNAYSRGEEAYLQFENERLTQGVKDLFDKMSVVRGKTFADISKKPKSKVTMNCLSLKENRNLLQRMLLIAQVRQLDLHDALTYPLGPVPAMLANFDETMTKTNKAVLAHHLEATFPEAIVDLSFKGKTAIMVDAMAMIQIQSRIPATFGEFASSIFYQLRAIAAKYGATRIDFVIDQYREQSIKDAERKRRATTGTLTEIRITRPTLNMPRQFKKYLASGKNKESLLLFLFESWKEYESECLQGITMYVTNGELCYRLQSADGVMDVTEIPELYCDHEEADTRLLLHAQHASYIGEADNIVIRSPDTDVLMLAVSCAHQLQGQLFLHQTSKNGKILHVNKISESLGDKTALALLSLHVFSGCDSVSAFKGKGKKKMIKLLLGSDTYTCTFHELGMSWTLSDTLMTQIESFVCDLYGQSRCSNVNEARYNCFRLGLQSDGALPPNKDSLKLHTQRANYQTAIYRRCLQAKMDAPSPHGHGWIVQDSDVSIQWMTLPPAPDSIINFVSCKCKKSGCSSRCSCREVELFCTELCQCVSCTNTTNIDESELGDEENDSFSDIESDIE